MADHLPGGDHLLGETRYQGPKYTVRNRQEPQIFLFVFEVTNSTTGPRKRNHLGQRINKCVNRDSTSLGQFFGVNGQLVSGFPRTLGDAKKLNGKNLSFMEGRSDLARVI